MPFNPQYIFVLVMIPLTMLLLAAFKRMAPATGLERDGKSYVAAMAYLLSFLVMIALAGQGLAAAAGPLIAMGAFLLLLGVVADRRAIGAVVIVALALAAAALLASISKFMLPNVSSAASMIVFIFVAAIILFFYGRCGQRPNMAEGFSFISISWVALLSAAQGAGFSDLAISVIWLSILAGSFLFQSFFAKTVKICAGIGGGIFLGVVSIWSVVYAVQHSMVTPMAAAFIVSIPAFDAFVCIVRKIIYKRAESLCDILIKTGYSERQARKILLCLTFIMGGTGIMIQAQEFPARPVLGLLFICFVLYVLLVNSLAVKNNSSVQ